MIISNAIICDVNGEKKADIKIENNTVVEIASNLEGDEIFDANGAYFIPMLIDTNIRLQDATLNAKNLQNISDEALKGGVGHIVINADSKPAIDNEIVLEFAQNGLHNINTTTIDLMLNTLQEDLSLSNIAILLKKGAIAPYMSTIAKNDIAIKIAEYVQMYDVTLFCKAEDNSLISNGVMLEGDVSSHLGLAGIPNLSEVLHVSRMIEIAKHFKIKILFKSLASPRSLKLINQARKDGIEVYAEVSIHHLLKSDEACNNFNTTAKLNPPLASNHDMKELQDALKNGQVDSLTTLHQPNSPLNKEVAFHDAAYGCEALGDAISLYYTKLVHNGLISMSKLIELTVKNPAKHLGLEAGEIKVGQPIKAMLFNPNTSKTINNQQSLYNNEELRGEILKTFF